jgi:hypothetical protein
VFVVVVVVVSIIDIVKTSSSTNIKSNGSITCRILIDGGFSKVMKLYVWQSIDPKVRRSSTMRQKRPKKAFLILSMGWGFQLFVIVVISLRSYSSPRGMAFSVKKR